MRQPSAVTRRAREVKESKSSFPQASSKRTHRTLTRRDGDAAGRRREDPKPKDSPKVTPRRILTRPRDTGKGGRVKVAHCNDESKKIFCLTGPGGG